MTQSKTLTLLTVLLTLVVCNSASSRTLAAAVITLANGDVIEGTVQGRVLVRRTGEAGNVAICVVEGKDISSIDQTGIRASGESVMLAGMKGATQDQVLQGLIFWDEGRRLKTGQGMIRAVGTAEIVGLRIDFASMKPFPNDKVLGEYEINEAAKRVTLLSSVRLKKGDGTVVTIPVAEIVASKQ